MMRFAFVLIFTVVLLLFGIGNLHVVELNTLFAHSVRASLSFLLMGAFGIGFVLATLVSLSRTLSRRKAEQQFRGNPKPTTGRAVLPLPPHIPVRPRVEHRRPQAHNWR